MTRPAAGAAVAAVVTAAALVGSTVLAALAGVLLAANGTGRWRPTPGWTGPSWRSAWPCSAAPARTAAAAGSSAPCSRSPWSTVFLAYARARGWTISRWAVGGAALGVGLVVTRLVETFGRPGRRPPTKRRAGWGRHDQHGLDAAPAAAGGELAAGAAGAASTGRPADPWAGAPRWENGPAAVGRRRPVSRAASAAAGADLAG